MGQIKLRYIFKNITRNGKKNLLVLVFMSALIFFISLYQIYIYKDERMVQNMYETIPVTAYITNKTTNNTKYTIPYGMIQDIIGLGMVEDYNVELSYIAYPIGLDIPWSRSYKQNTNNEIIQYDTSQQSKLYGVTSLSTSKEIPLDIHIIYGKEYNESSLDTENPVCIISDRHMNENGLDYGDTITLLGEPYETALNSNSSNENEKTGIEFTIIGCYFYYTEELDPSKFRNNDFIVSAKGFLKEFDLYFVNEEPQEEQYEYYRGVFNKKVVKNAKFTLKNIENIDILYEYLDKNQILSKVNIDGVNSHTKLDLEIRINALEQVIIPLKNNIQMKYILMNLIYTIFCMIGIIICIILQESRKNEIKLQYIIGMTKKYIIINNMLEQIIISLLGVTLVFVVLVITNRKYIPFIYMNVFMYYSIYIILTLMACIFSIRKYMKMVRR